ncbi:hypothetical protein E2542_SST22663 [Spatholobus suberectus]|nr:hypothetical protein E2542_SST22663 [Spatholobus suberectus]
MSNAYGQHHGTYSSFELNSRGVRTSSVERRGIAATPFGEEVGVAHAEEVALLYSQQVHASFVRVSHKASFHSSPPVPLGCLISVKISKRSC